MFGNGSEPVMLTRTASDTGSKSTQPVSNEDRKTRHCERVRVVLKHVRRQTGPPLYSSLFPYSGSSQPAHSMIRLARKPPG